MKWQGKEIHPTHSGYWDKRYTLLFVNTFLFITPTLHFNRNHWLIWSIGTNYWKERGVQNWVLVLTKRTPTMFLPRLCQANTAPIVGEMRHSSCQTSRIEFILQRISNTLYSSSFVNVKSSCIHDEQKQIVQLAPSYPQGSDIFSSAVKVRAAKGKQWWGKLISPSCHQAAAPNLVCFLFICSCCWPCFWCAGPWRNEQSGAHLEYLYGQPEGWERSGWRRAGPGVLDIV